MTPQSADAVAAAQPAGARLPAHISLALRDLRPTLGPLLPPDVTEEQFRAALYLEITGCPALHDCTPDSLRTCAIRAATHGMLPGRDCHFLPFRTKGRKEATYVPNYFGIILALERSGKVRRAFAHAVHEGDAWGFDMFADRPTHTPAVALGQKAGKALFYYGAVMFHDGTCAFEILTREDLDGLKKRSPAGEQSVWLTDYDMMARKSAIKRVAKYVRLTPKVQEMLAEEEDRPVNEARHAQNMVDLFGEPPPSMPGAPVALDAPRKEPPARPKGPQPTHWRDILTQYESLAEDELAAKVHAALADPDYAESAGNALAMLLADLAARGQEGER